MSRRKLINTEILEGSEKFDPHVFAETVNPYFSQDSGKVWSICLPEYSNLFPWKGLRTFPAEID